MMKISIITATFNNESTIADTMYAVNSQSYKNIEHVIIDGKSTDKTLEIINKTKTNSTVVISESDTGIYDALNKGIKLATGDIIALLHADDIYADNNILKNAVELFETQNTDSVYADLQYVSKNNINKIVRYWKSGNFEYKKLKKGWMPPHPTFLIKKNIYEKYGYFDTNFKIAADYDIILRFLGKYKITTAYLPQVMTKMRVGGASNKSLKNIILKMKEDAKALRKNGFPSWRIVFMKNFSKIHQLFKK